MSLKEQLQNRLKEAMRAKDKTALTAVRMILARIKNAEIEAGEDLSDQDVVKVLTALTRQYRDSIDQFQKAGREDLVMREKSELAILEKYLPEQLKPEEIEALIKQGITETGASGPGDLGSLMKWVMPRVAGRADGKVVNTLVRDLLGG